MAKELNQSTQRLLTSGLLISMIFVLSACGWFGGGADTTEETTAQSSSNGTAGEANADNNQVSNDSSGTTSSNDNGESADADQSTNTDQGESMITDSGLEIITIKEGTGPKPNPGDIVQVHYVGTLENGTKFDSSVDRGEPIGFPLGQGRVIKGWDEGIALINQGGKAKLIIPPELGYGAQGAGGVIPPNAKLIFEVELVSIQEGAPASPKVVPAADYIETDSGLKYFDFATGEGKNPEKGQTVSLHYTGWLTDGTKFDSSLDRGEPFSFALGTGQVIQGWDEGVASMQVGTKRQLVIPADLGYGSRGAGGVIPPDATLIFEVELLSIR